MAEPPARPTPPRLVATDLDGTLLDRDGAVGAYTRTVLEALDARDVPVVFVTGRPVRWMVDLWDAVGGHGLAICSNGAITYDVTARRVREVRPVPPAVVLEVAERLRAVDPGVGFAVERTDGIGLDPSFRLRGEARNPLDDAHRGPLADLLTEPVAKVLAQHTTRDPEEFWHLVEETVGDLVTTTWSSSTALVEMSAVGVTKASTLELLCRELGVGPADVVAFGDMPNDVPMLHWAGTAYAMADAHPTARAAADRTAPPHHEDGVARVLADLFDLG